MCLVIFVPRGLGELELSLALVFVCVGCGCVSECDWMVFSLS